MKKSYLVLIFLSPILAFSQMTIDAGRNQHICPNHHLIIDTVQLELGGNPTAFGGTPPYTYCWSIDPIELFPGLGIFLYASDLLNDTTIPNPTLMEVYPMNCLNTNYFKLTVKDNVGTTLTDSVQVTGSLFYHHLGYLCLTINQGDSVFLNDGSNMDGGIGNLSYLWQPSHGLSDTTLFTGFWAKPDSSIAYYVTVTDSMGCQRTGSPLYYITVNQLSIDENTEIAFTIFPNPANHSVTIQLGNLGNDNTNIMICNVMGQVVKSISTNTSPTIEIGVNELTNGLYFVTLSTAKKQLTKKLLIQH